MTFARLEAGKRGEELVVAHLKKEGYKIITRNYRTKAGEIDIIGDDKGCISFIEVRYSNSRSFCPPRETVDTKKQAQIAKTALSYIKRYTLEDVDCRFDVVCVEDVDTDFPKIRLIKDAFELRPRYSY